MRISVVKFFFGWFLQIILHFTKNNTWRQHQHFNDVLGSHRAHGKGAFFSSISVRNDSTEKYQWIDSICNESKRYFLPLIKKKIEKIMSNRCKLSLSVSSATVVRCIISAHSMEMVWCAPWNTFINMTFMCGLYSFSFFHLLCFCMHEKRNQTLNPKYTKMRMFNKIVSMALFQFCWVYWQRSPFYLFIRNKIK